MLKIIITVDTVISVLMVSVTKQLLYQYQTQVTNNGKTRHITDDNIDSLYREQTKLDIKKKTIFALLDTKFSYFLVQNYLI